MHSQRLIATLLLLWTLGGCAATRTADDTGWRQRPHAAPSLRLPPLTSTACPGGVSPRSRDAFTLALPGTVNPLHAPLPRSEAERHLFNSCYETLVRIDCEGLVEPGLAQHWQAYDRGRRWVFTLRDDARFWNGRPLDAAHVVESWKRAEEICRQAGEPTPFLRFSPHGGALQVLGPRELAIHLHTPDDLFPALLAHPALAVTGEIDDLGWPAGSGPLRPRVEQRDGLLVLAPTLHHPEAPAWASLEVLLSGHDDPGDDPGDALSAGADVLITRQRSAVDHYAVRTDLVIEPLPWDRSYYLVVPTEETGASARDRRRWTSGWEPLELAREVCRQEAEPSAFFPFEPLLGTCPVLPPAVRMLDRPPLGDRSILASRETDLILWPDSDPDAGLLAERIAELAARPLGAGPLRPGSGPLTRPPQPQPGVAPEAVAVPAPLLTAHVQSARGGAFVLPWPHRWASPCDELARLLTLADWLAEAGFEPGPHTRAVPEGATPAWHIDDHEPPRALAVARRLERSRTVQPMLRTRAVLVRHPMIAGLSCNHDGSVRLWTGGWLEESPR